MLYHDEFGSSELLTIVLLVLHVQILEVLVSSRQYSLLFTTTEVSISDQFNCLYLAGKLIFALSGCSEYAEQTIIPVE
jgi:hypothetical protein